MGEAPRSAGRKERSSTSGPAWARMSRKPFAASCFAAATNKPKEKSELKSVVEQMESAQLDSGSSPHVIYCARGATLSEAGTYGGYLVVHDELTKSIHGHELADETMALAGFLRVVTGFFAASGLLSSSMHIDLAPQGTVPSPIRVELADAKPPFKRLHEELLARRPSNEPFDELLIRWLSEMKSGTTSIDRRGGDMKWKVATGHDAEGAPTAGFMLSVSAVSAGDPDYAAFFYRRKVRELVCCDSSADAVDRWPISETNGDTFSSYMLRIMLEAERRRQALRGPAEK